MNVAADPMGMPTVDERFLAESIDAATRRVNPVLSAADASIAALNDVSEIRSLWRGPSADWHPMLVEAGTPGLQKTPMPPHAAVSEVMIAAAGGQSVRLLILHPPGEPKGTYFYIHGGGWVAQSPDDYLPFLWKFCQDAGVSVVAPQYRLAPEHPFPAGPDDVYAAAQWLFQSGQTQFTGPFIIGGDSAGAHMAVLTLQRLRDEEEVLPFAGADLVYGCYDFNLTPSARMHGAKFPLSTGMIQLCVDWASVAMNKFDPKISPLYGSVKDMPPALFTVGTGDPFVDDTLFMERRWRSAGIATALAVYPGGVHGFDWMPLAIGAQSLERRIGFLNERLAAG